tara:strand:+ start:3520 stop:3891 length:372 start_codon:yes stop_codon:yes gene_type:complete
MINLTIIAIGGALGSLSRYYLSNTFLKNFVFFDIPFAILAINALGSLFFGFFMGLYTSNIIASDNLKVFVLTGFLAAFTTFSTFAWESIVLFQNEMYIKLVIYCIASIILSISFCLLGYVLGK